MSSVRQVTLNSTDLGNSPQAAGTFFSFDGGARASGVLEQPDRYRYWDNEFFQTPVISRGAGLSYAAASFINHGRVVSHTKFNRIIGFDRSTQTVEVESGIYLYDVYKFLYRHKLYLPIQPGHGRITVGGCVAADVHGKNQARDGTFINQVESLTLYHPKHGMIELSRSQNPELFRLTCGGYGLTGHIIRVKLRVTEMSAGLVKIKAVRFSNIVDGIDALVRESRMAEDVYPQQSGVVIGRQGFDYRPRPAFLSLNAHTAELAQLNARYLFGDKAPDFLLFQILPEHLRVNNRYPALADGSSWPSIMSNYDLLDTSTDFLVLSKQNSHPEYQQKLLFEKNISWDEPIDLPIVSSGLIWAEIEIKRSLWGEFLHILYKSPHVLISLQTKDDNAHQFQLVPGLAEAGFLLSPFVNDTLSFAQLQQRQIPISSLVKSFNLTSPNAPNGFWTDKVTLRLYEISLPALKKSNLPDYARHLLELQMLAGNAVTCLFPPKLEGLNGSAENVLSMHAPCKTEIPVSTEKQSLTIKFGLQENSYTGTTKTDGVSVEIVAVSSDGSEYKRWSRILNPQYNIEDRSVQQMTVNWQKGTVAKIYLNFLPGINGDPAYDHSFVQDIVFE